jgi:hypothetical protein
LGNNKKALNKGRLMDSDVETVKYTEIPTKFTKRILLPYSGLTVNFSEKCDN